MTQSEPIAVETLIIGAGAAGIMAAISACERGAKSVVVLEAGERPARKILIATSRTSMQINRITITVPNQDFHVPSWHRTP